MANETNSKDNIEAFSLRLPAELKSLVSEIARDEKRSLNTQIVHVLENYVRDRQTAKPIALAS